MGREREFVTAQVHLSKALSQGDVTATFGQRLLL